MERSSDYVAGRSGTQKFRVDWKNHTRLASMNSSITKGRSFKTGIGDGLQTLILKYPQSIVVGLQITNFSRFALVEPSTTTFYGICPQPAIPISEGSKEIIIAHKKGYALSGTNGVVSWKINDENNNRRLFVLWDCPYFSSNKMAVGFTLAGTETFKDSWGQDIMRDKQNRNIVYEKAIYSKKCEELIAKDENKRFLITGTMGTGSKPVLYIDIKPNFAQDLAASCSSIAPTLLNINEADEENY